MMIEQRSLYLIERMEDRMIALERKLATTKQEYQRAATRVIKRLRAGDEIERGLRIAAIKIHRRRVIAWRKQFEAKLGKEEMERVVSLVTPTERRELVITRRRA